MINKKQIKNIIGIEDGLKSRIKNRINYSVSNKYKKIFDKYKGKKKAILTLTPTHGNLGDHAIAYAAFKYIKDNFKDYELIELDIFEIYKYAKPLNNILTENDIIFTIGGGNMNNHYKIEEETRRFIINTFKKTKIVSLPQTISFSNDKKGKREFEKTKEIYNANRNLTVIAREDTSFNIMKECFYDNKVIKNPDMVLYLEKFKVDGINSRTKIMTCLRDDLEGYITSEKRTEIINKLKDKYKDIEICDTVIDKNVNKETRENELKTIWFKFLSSKVVITDRLHGMIFCVITKTPCIVIRTFDHKVVESYKWLNHLNYIKFTENYSAENLIKLSEELISINEKTTTNFKNEYFKGLRNKLNL